MKLHIIWAVLFALTLTGFATGFYFYTQDTQVLKDLVEKQKEELLVIKQSQQQDLESIKGLLLAYQEGVNIETKELENLLTRQENQFKSQIQDIERKKEISENLLTSTNKDLALNIESLTDKLFTLESKSKTELTQKWDDITVRLECEYETQERSFGSGLYFDESSVLNFGAGNEHVILTNSHVLEEGDEIPISCDVIWSDGTETKVSFGENESIAQASFFEGFDAAFITLDQNDVPSSVLGNTTTYDVCRLEPQIGDEILVLGYPKIGSTESITTTEGIISGYDREFFITSAKISKGNSGGAAISIKDDCYFGIPTLVKADAVESLGRILNITNIFQ